ncbi:MAG: hypothetical protein IKO32_06280, partial [Lachnospiraceae bacterium]|nr:hypothetical protein [Lachnospiraceae bacterium]
MKITANINNKKHKFIRFTALSCALFLVLFVAGCKANAQPITKTAFFFNTVITITFYSESDAALFP